MGSGQSRKSTLTVDELWKAKASGASITDEEIRKYKGSLESFGRMRERLPDPARKSADLAKLDRYSTTHQQKKPKSGEPYYQVITAPDPNDPDGYLTHFYMDGRIGAISTYSPKMGAVPMSTVLYYQHRYLVKVLEGDGKTIKPPLSSLTIHDVSNVNTNDTARLAYFATIDVGKKIPAKWENVWKMDVDNEAVQALLGCDNGRAAYYIWKDWEAELGIQGIETIEVTKQEPETNRQVNMIFTFKRA